MRVLVVGGTGTVGSEVARALRDRGASVRVMTRSAARAARVPSGVEVVVGDLHAPEKLPAVFGDAEAVFIATPVSQTETEDGLAAVWAARQVGARRLVFMSVAGAETAKHVPHYASKLPIERAVAECGIAHTILRPNNLFQNDRSFYRAIVEQGVYPQPIGDVGVSRIDARDIADAAANALLTGGHAGKTYTLGGGDELTGEETARIYGGHLGREVRYAGDDLDAWSERARATLPAWMVHDLRIMYEHLQEHGQLASDAELAQARRVVGHALRTFEEFAAATVAAWRSPS